MKKIIFCFLLMLLSACGGGGGGGDSSPPPTDEGDTITSLAGASYMDPDIITPSDPTAYLGIVSLGQDSRWMFDRRIEDFENVVVHLFQATYYEGYIIEFRVNLEFDYETALARSEKYARMFGQLPSSLRTNLDKVWIHDGYYALGGGSDGGIVIPVEMADRYETDGMLEEGLLHETGHVAFDAVHDSSPEYLAARDADGAFISDYAMDYPDREDMAESLVGWVAVGYRSDRISIALENYILDTIPNRLDYFDALGLNMYPIVP